MNKNDILRGNILNFHPRFNEEILSLGIEKFDDIYLESGEHILLEGDYCDFIFFAESSIVRCYIIDDNGEENTLWIEPERMFLTDFESYKQNIPSKCYMQLYENSKVYILKKKELLNLYQTYHDWALFGVLIMESYFMRSLDILNRLIYSDATEAYHFIEKHYPRYLEVVPLKHIASRLNVSPVSISRVRSGTQKKNN
ncbi:Crp/Fnr family transcriptional regulator [Riemerella anatipestifer]|uniref:Crp/Fnr family transcriptional regulator n=1 Tax=Riemerella anatipestifer TaxID=34085 RepID=UPI002A842708|nr:Crp/Fnr family transcriptional regulator [Riemerella anatipestifer]MDY3357008.1 Crp/Fnr family transcriptional regulator [Riemerella anatipestifer]MDY3537073.1 Crp/Fnr family transcriptional regulator [Riemerella anatipestifer]